MEKVDEIRREVVIDAPIEKVWRAISSQEEIAKWFGDISEVELRRGGAARFGWTEYESVSEAVVEVVDEPHRFAYRWALDSNKPFEESLTTLVEFTLEPRGSGTHLTLVESGFAELPDVQYQEHFGTNSDGWDSELEDLKIYLAGVRPIV